MIKVISTVMHCPTVPTEPVGNANLMPDLAINPNIIDAIRSNHGLLCSVLDAYQLGPRELSIFSSPRKRATGTAEILMEGFKSEGERFQLAQGITPKQGLKEQGLGVKLERMTVAKIIEQYPNFPNMPELPGGESIEELLIRVENFIKLQVENFRNSSCGEIWLTHHSTAMAIYALAHRRELKERVELFKTLTSKAELRLNSLESIIYSWELEVAAEGISVFDGMKVVHQPKGLADYFDG